ncbi:MAG TPA: hypothetical protein VGD22_19870, partial [Sphingobacteriaceae bacterium]
MKDQKVNQTKSRWNSHERKPYQIKAFLNKYVLITFLMATILACRKEEPQTSGSSNAGKSTTSSISGTPGYYSIATYNTRRIPTGGEGVVQREWPVRRPLVKDMVLKYSFDIFGVQEPLGSQIADMISDLSPYGYAKFGVSDKDDVSYQHQDIFYKTSKFT